MSGKRKDQIGLRAFLLDALTPLYRAIKVINQSTTSLTCQKAPVDGRLELFSPSQSNPPKFIFSQLGLQQNHAPYVHIITFTGPIDQSRYILSINLVAIIA